MTDGQLVLDDPIFRDVDRQWRLARIEVANWGTFNGYHALDLSRKGVLITGSSGSGKSTLLDAIATVLTPPRVRRFNAAAQSDLKGEDRTIVSYIRGAWRQETDETGEVVSAYLRATEAVWSGILLRYECLADSTTDQSASTKPITLVALFNIKAGSNNNEDVEKLYGVVRGDYRLPDFEQYAVNGIKLREFKKDISGAKAAREHGEFAACFRQLMGISSSKTLELLHKTQAAKNFGSLDRLFRDFMLDEPDTFRLAREAVDQFSELKEAHEGVVDQRLQRDCLAPLVEIDERVRDALNTQREIHRLTENINPLREHLIIEVLEGKRQTLRMRQSRLKEQSEQALQQLETARQNYNQAEALVNEKGGVVVDDAKKEIDAKEQIRRSVNVLRSELLTDLRPLAMTELPRSQSAWEAMCASLHDQALQAQQTLIDERENDREKHARVVEIKRELRAIEDELAQLRRQSSNIPAQYARLRAAIARHVGISADHLPYMGELITIKPGYEAWQGAIERLIGRRSLTLLVPERYAALTAAFVDRQNLGLRFEFVSVPCGVEVTPQSVSRNSVLRRIEVVPFKPYPELNLWVNDDLRRRFDYVCVESAEDLAQHQRALTIQGQIKTDRRYIKDDRFAVDDRSRWLLGNDNEAKLEVYEARKADQLAALRDAEAAADATEAVHQRTYSLMRVAEKLSKSEWDAYDIEKAEEEVRKAQEQYELLCRSNTELDAARRLRDEARQARDQAEDRAQEAEAARRVNEQALTTCAADIEKHVGDLAAEPPLDHEVADTLKERFLAADPHALESVERVWRAADAVRALLNRELAATLEREKQARSEGERVMVAYRNRWRAAAANLSESFEDVDGYLGIYRQIQMTGLPRHEDQFLDLLKEFSRDRLTTLASYIHRAINSIRGKLEPVNESLELSDYDEGTHLSISIIPSRSRQANEFLDELKAITSDSYGSDDLEVAEPRYLRAERIITRLRSSEYADRQWQRQCLDTRLHVRFVAKELDAQGTVVRVYENDAGLSGGQKQKLVIFCLAAALRYQLADEGQIMPRYGTVVLDEAFDKADYQYASSALDIFEAFGFHMVLATPLRLLQTIEPHVGEIIMVKCYEGRDSRLLPITFEDVGDADSSGSKE